MLSPGTYILFLDESGTHDMNHVDPAFPVFVLMGLLVGTKYYAKTLVPRVKRLKLRHLGSADVVLHSSDIRKRRGIFGEKLDSEEKRQAFYDDINSIFLYSRIRLFAVVIDKQRLRTRFLSPPNPYDVSLSQILSLVCSPAAVDRPRVEQITAESRGGREDRQLQREYQSLRLSGLWSYGAKNVANRRAGTAQKLLPARVQFARKDVGVTGLELADLAAFPVAKAIINTSWEWPPSKVVQAKLGDRLIVFP